MATPDSDAPARHATTLGALCVKLLATNHETRQMTIHREHETLAIDVAASFANGSGHQSPKETHHRWKARAKREKLHPRVTAVRES